MSVPKLDKNVAGEIHPPYDGAMFSMNEGKATHYFAGNGDYVFSEEGGKRSRAAPAKAEKPAAASGGGAPAEKPAAASVDVIAWAKGEQKAEWFKIKAAAKALDPNVDTSSNAAMLKKSLVVLGHISAGDVK